MAKFILDTSFGQVRWINGYRGVQRENIIDLDGSSVVGHFTEGKQDLKQSSTEFQLAGTAFEDQLNFATGLTYFRETGLDRKSTRCTPVPNAQLVCRPLFENTKKLNNSTPVPHATP